MFECTLELKEIEDICTSTPSSQSRSFDIEPWVSSPWSQAFATILCYSFDVFLMPGSESLTASRGSRVLGSEDLVLTI